MKIATTIAPASIRWMIRRDYPAVIEIEREAFGRGAWTEEDLIAVLRVRSTIGAVLETAAGSADAKIVAYMLYDLRMGRIQVINFAVHRSERRKGYGRQMADRLKSKLSRQWRWIDMVVSERNLGMQCFLRACGFRASITVRHYFDDDDADAYYFMFDPDKEADT